VEDEFPAITRPFDLATPWWPFRMAVAWVMTRDRKITGQMSFSRSVKGVYAILDSNRYLGHPLERYCDSVEDALRKLVDAISEGSVATEGTQFERWGAISSKEPRSKILPAEIGSLQYETLGGEDCLISFDQRGANESNRRNFRGYRDVHVLRNDLMSAFPLERQPPTIPKRKQAEWQEDDAISGRAKSVRRASQREAVERAIKALWPDCSPMGSVKTITTRINGWLKEQNANEVSEDTVSRVLRSPRPS
jgi:hypothetical protein